MVGEITMKKPFILIKASGMPMVGELEKSIKQAGYKIDSIYNISNGWETISQFYLNDPTREEFNLEVEIHAWLEKYLFGESAYIIFIDTEQQKTLEQKCQDALAIKKDFRDKFTLSRDGTFMVAMDVERTPFKPLVKWHKGELKVSEHIFDTDMPQKGTFRGYYFKYAHTPDNVAELDRHLEILTKANILTEENRVYPREWRIIKSAVLGDHEKLMQEISQPKNPDEGNQNQDEFIK